MSFPLKYKILSVFSIFSLLLFLTLIIYYYISGSESITIESENKLSEYSRQAEENYEDFIADSFSELNGLAVQIKFNQSSNVTTEKDLVELLEKFIRGYPLKYNAVNYVKGPGENPLKVFPLKVFSGEIRIVNEYVDSSRLGKEVFEHVDRLTEKDDTAIIVDLKSKFENITLLKLVSAEFRNYLMVEIQFSHMADYILEKLRLQQNFYLYIVNENEFVLFSNDKQHQNINISEIYGDLSIKDRGILTEKIFESDDYLFLMKPMDDLNVTIVLAENLKNTKNEFRTVIFNSMKFSGLLFVILVGLIYFFAERISNTLNKVTITAAAVAEGDFTRRLNIKRKDEIGILVESFNEMVDKLQASYAELNNLNLELKDKVEELVEAKTELSRSQKLALIGETTAKISHEIQNKIGGISIWIQNLESQIGEDEISQIYLNEMRASLNSFLDMLINFKKFYRRPVVNLQKADLKEILGRVICGYSNEINKKGIIVEMNFDEGTYPVNADLELMEELFINLLINSVYYSDQNGRIEIRVTSEKEYVSLYFTDFGKGIAAEDKIHLFEPFFSTKKSGSGLGLAIAKNIVVAHGGKIEYVENEQKGATFRIILPMKFESNTKGH